MNISEFYEISKINESNITDETVLIFTGRFEPLHIGHIEFLKKLRNKYKNNHILICILTIDRTESSDSILTVETSKKMDKKNSPLPDKERLMLFQKVLENEKELNNCSVSFRIRPDLYFDLSLEGLPSNRCFVFSSPERDIHEASKIEFHIDIDEKFIIFDVETIVNLNLSASTLRKQLEEGDESLLFIPEYLRSFFKDACLKYFKNSEEN